MPCKSVIAEPQSEATVTVSSTGEIDVKGYALPYGDQGPVTKVEISTDDGKSWIEAEITKGGGKWSWALWKATVKLDKGKGRRILS